MDNANGKAGAGEAPALECFASGSVESGGSGTTAGAQYKNDRYRMQGRRDPALRCDVIRSGSGGTSRDWAAQADPRRNAQFSRGWAEPDVSRCIGGVEIGRGGSIMIWGGGVQRSPSLVQFIQILAVLKGTKAQDSSDGGLARTLQAIAQGGSL